MGYDRWYTLLHLTPSGWLQGKESEDKPTEFGPIPDDCIETWLEECESHDSGWGKLHRRHQLLWASSGHTEEEREQQRKTASTQGITYPDGSKRWGLP
jgi:hypothetical protein